jgi:hypothetical protein
LRAGVVKLRGLADHNGATADNEDAFHGAKVGVGSLWRPRLWHRLHPNPPQNSYV